MTMGTEGGGKRRTWAEVSAGHVAKCPASMARHQVDRAGEKRAAWKNATRLAMVALEVGRSALACRNDGLTVDGVEGEEEAGEARSRVHRLVVGERYPRKRSWSWSVMVTESVRKVATHPWSQSRPIERSEPDVSGGGGRRKRVVKGEGGGVGGGDCVTVWEKDGDAWDGRLTAGCGEGCECGCNAPCSLC